MHHRLYQVMLVCVRDTFVNNLPTIVLSLQNCLEIDVQNLEFSFKSDRLNSYVSHTEDM